MYAILVNEPGAEVSSYILPTGVSTPKEAVELMSSRAEEFISEQLELGVDAAEDYIIDVSDLAVVVCDPNATGQPVRISFEASVVELAE